VSSFLYRRFFDWRGATLTLRSIPVHETLGTKAVVFWLEAWGREKSFESVGALDLWGWSFHNICSASLGPSRLYEFKRRIVVDYSYYYIIHSCIGFASCLQTPQMGRWWDAYFPILFAPHFLSHLSLTGLPSNHIYVSMNILITVSNPINKVGSFEVPIIYITSFTVTLAQFSASNIKKEHECTSMTSLQPAPIFLATRYQASV
jgi:hypothetical protein